MATEKRLIDAKALCEKLADKALEAQIYDECEEQTIKECMAVVQRMPTVDAVERYEYDAIVEKLENLLCHATGGKFSKAGYSWEDMERMVTDHIEECCEEAIAEEVVHGRWEQVQMWATKAKYRCSVCGREIMSATKVNIEKYPYCHCGAKMDGDADG